MESLLEGFRHFRKEVYPRQSARFQGQPGVEIHGIGRRASDLPNYHRIDLSQAFSLDWVTST